MGTTPCSVHVRPRRPVLGRGPLLLALALLAMFVRDHGPGHEAPWRDDPRLAVLASAFAARPVEEPREPPETIDELRERIAEVLAVHDVPGVGLALIQRDGEVWSGGVGVTDRETGVAIEADTMFRVGSITKTVVALAILGLVEQGRLDLDTPVRDIAPEVIMSNAWEDQAPITVAHLLEHTAGFDDMRFNELYVPGEGAAEVGLIEALARNPRSRVSRWRPGDHHAYSNPGYSVAAYVIEKVTGESYERYIERAILRPLGMWESSFERTPAVQRHLARGHDGGRQRPVPYRRLYHRAPGDLKSSPRELARLVKVLIDRGRTRNGSLLRADAIGRMERAETRVQPLVEVSYGLGNAGDPSFAVPTRGHGGAILGFMSEYRYAAPLGVGYVLLFNSSGPDVVPAYAQIRALVFDYLTRGLALPAPAPVPASPSAPASASPSAPAPALEPLAGYYELASPRHELVAFLERVLLEAEVRVVGDRLHLRLGSSGFIPLEHAGSNRFRLPGHGVPAVAFGTRDDGMRVMFLMDFTFDEGTAWLSNVRRMLALAYSLMQVGTFWNFLWIPAWLVVMVRARRRLPIPPGAAPALAALSFFSMLALVQHGLSAGHLGHVHAVSIGVLLLGLSFPVASAWALARAIIVLRRGDPNEPDDELAELASLAALGMAIYDRSLRGRIYDLAVALACLGMSLYLTFHGVIGLRTWAW